MGKLNYHSLKTEIKDKILEDKAKGYINTYRFQEKNAVRRQKEHDNEDLLWRPTFVRDCEKILHLPYYNRYTDKTQVFSFYQNDDITRRALHVQLVSRIARNIGQVLGLNCDLIEAIALGHDIGHTPFGHAGERLLNEQLQLHNGRHFSHNVQSVRILDNLFCRNITLQTLDGILCHNGEIEKQEYYPDYKKDFVKFDSQVEDCYRLGEIADKQLRANTLEGCVVRICDIIAYLGKDRQDAKTAKLFIEDSPFTSLSIGVENAELINNLTVDILENSYGKSYIALSKQAFSDLKQAKKENYQFIYGSKQVEEGYDCIRPMFEKMYQYLLRQVEEENKESVIFRHHIDFLQNNRKYYSQKDYFQEEKNQIVVDYISSMTDDYFLALYQELFPKDKIAFPYHTYFKK